MRTQSYIHQKRRPVIAVFLCIIVIALFLCSRAFCDDNKNDLYDSYLKATDAEKIRIVNDAADTGDAGLPSLKQMLTISLEKSHEKYENVLNAIARIGTEKAAIVLRKEATRSKKIDPSVPIKYLANMGKTGLKQLINLAESKKLALSSKTLMPSISPTREASRARDAIVLIHDPAAAADLGTLISNTWLRVPALKALSNMKASGYEEQALNIWRNKSNYYKERGYALGYLLSVGRDKYLPLLQAELRAFDAEVARLIRDNKELHAKKVRTFLCCDQENLLRTIFYMGGDTVTATSLAVFAESGLWNRRYERRMDHEQIFLAILDLGLSHSPNAKATLLHFLQEDLLIKPRIDDLDKHFSYEHPRWPWFYKYERGINKNDGFPICAVAAIALGELGDSTAIPPLEEAAKNNPDLKKVFDTAISMLRKCAGENEMCGGLAGVLCCPGLTCKLEGNYPDASGVCVE